MDATQRIRQAQACHIRFKELVSSGIVPEGITVYDYAFQILSRRVESLKTLEDWELNALRDRLEGKENKGLRKLNETAAAAGIASLAGWMRHMSKRPAFAYLRGYSPETLPADRQWRLAKCLGTRSKARLPAARTRQRQEPQGTLF
jgi:hypothetical protein